MKDKDICGYFEKNYCGLAFACGVCYAAGKGK